MSEPVRNHIQEMLEAFNAATGMDLGMSVLRKRCLLAIRAVRVVPQFDAADVAAVMEELKGRVKRMPQRYDHTSLEFSNAIAQTDRFEERARKLRKRMEAKAAAVEAASKRPSPAVPTISQDEQERLFQTGADRLRKFRDQLKGPRL